MRQGPFPRPDSDPTAMARKGAGATTVAAQDLRLLGERGRRRRWPPGKMVTPLAGKGFNVWSPSQRKMGNLEHERAMGPRVGLSADGSASPRLKTPPPAPRKASRWQVLPVLAYPGHVGRTPTLQTDATLGNPVLDYQAVSVGFRRREKAKSIFARMTGRAPEDHDASERSLSQRAKVAN